MVNASNKLLAARETVNVTAYLPSVNGSTSIVLVEAYDDIFVTEISSRYADQILLDKFSEDVLKGIKNDEKVIMILTHPRNWKVDIIANTQENLRRIIQGVAYI